MPIKKANNQKQKKIPFNLRMVLLWYKILEITHTQSAFKLALKFFFTSFRTPRTASQKLLQESSELTYIDMNGNKVNVYKWGNGTKKALLVHGWSGYGLQFEHFVPVLLAQGYTVIVFDAVAHGRSEGETTTVVEFIAIIHKLIEQEGNVEMLLGHSLGGIAISHFAFDVRVSRLGLISSPSSSKTVLNTFQNKMNVSDVIIKKIEDYISENLKTSLTSFFPDELFKEESPIKSVLLIQDKKDKEFLIEELYVLQKLIKNNVSYVSEGWGHTRVLENPKVIEVFKDFVR